MAATGGYLRSAGPIDFASSIQPSPRGRAAQLDRPRSRSAATLNVQTRTPRASSDSSLDPAPRLSVAEVLKESGRGSHTLEEMVQAQVRVGAVLALVGVRVGHQDGRQMQDVGEGPDGHAAAHGRRDDGQL